MTRFAVINPATEETIVEVEEAGVEEADEQLRAPGPRSRPGGQFPLPHERGFFAT